MFDAVADLLNLEVDLIFFDTTSTYFETEDADVPVWRDERGRVTAQTTKPTAEQSGEPTRGGEAGTGEQVPPGAAGQAGFRTHGKSTDSRDDLPQVIVGMAVTRDGIPVRVWCWPNAVAFMAAGAGSSAQSQGRVVFREFRASSSDTTSRAA